MSVIIDRALAALEKTGVVSIDTAFGPSKFAPVVDRELLKERGFAPITLNQGLVGYCFFDGQTLEHLIVGPGDDPQSAAGIEGLSQMMKPFESDRYAMKAIVPLPQSDVDTTDTSLGRFIASRLITYGYILEGLNDANSEDGTVVLVDILTDIPYVVTCIALPGLLVIMHDKEAQSLLTAA